MENNRRTNGSCFIWGNEIMKQLIETYVYNVIKRLPEKQQEDVKNELTANIYDMVSETDTLDDVKTILNQLGDPKKLAHDYQVSKRVVVNSEVYDKYLSLLISTLVVLGIIGTLVGVLSGIERTVHVTNVLFRSMRILGYTVIFLIGALILGYATVTFIFHLDGLFNQKDDHTKWDMSMLEEKPRKGIKTYTKKSVNIWFSIMLCIGLIGMYLIHMQPKFIFGQEPILQKQVSLIFFPLFGISMIFALVVAYMKIKAGKLTLKVAMVSTIYYVVTAVFMIAFILQEDLFTPFVYQHISVDMLQMIKTIFCILLGLIVIIHVLFIWMKTFKK